MKTLRSGLGVMFGLLAGAASAQDALLVAPQAYRLQMENDWVRVVRVRYEPHERIGAHDHNPTAAAYVYLNDGGPVVFNHLDKEYGAVTRAATRAGSFRVYFGIQEVHEVVNTSALPSEFLRVEFKTEPKDELTLKGRFFRETYPAGENVSKIEFENAQVRITRLILATGLEAELVAGPAEPALFVALTDLHLGARRSGGPRIPLVLKTGHSDWLSARESVIFENVGDAHAEMLRFDFKTRPLSAEELLFITKKHDHGAK